jgi:hypothetical protein
MMSLVYIIRCLNFFFVFHHLFSLFISSNWRHVTYRFMNKIIPFSKQNLRKIFLGMGFLFSHYVAFLYMSLQKAFLCWYKSRIKMCNSFFQWQGLCTIFAVR